MPGQIQYWANNKLKDCLKKKKHQNQKQEEKKNNTQKIQKHAKQTEAAK